MSWYLPDLDPYILYAWKELVRWTMANVTALALITAILSWLKMQAMKTENVLDDKIISLLIYLVSFSWLPGLAKTEPEKKEEES
jgi:hypothetical protein